MTTHLEPKVTKVKFAPSQLPPQEQKNLDNNLCAHLMLNFLIVAGLHVEHFEIRTRDNGYPSTIVLNLSSQKDTAAKHRSQANPSQQKKYLAGPNILRSSLMPYCYVS